MNPCCPDSFSACVSESKVGALCGVKDPDDDPNAKRPSFYQEKTTTTTTSVNICNADSDCTYPRPESTTVTGNTTSTQTLTLEYSVNENGVCVNETKDPTYVGSSTYSSTQACCPGFDGCGTDDWFCSSTQNPDGSWSGSVTNCNDFPGNPNDPCSTWGTSSTCFNENPFTTCPEPIVTTVVYSSEDTESAALSRVDDWTQGSNCVTSDYRTGVNKNFVSKTTVKHEAIVTRLVIGFCYEGVIPIERALINYDEFGNRISPEPEDWLPFSLTAISPFTAAEVFQTFGLGSLNVSDVDFIDANFSLDPYDYPSYFPVDPETGILINPDALVLTPFSDLPRSKNYDYRVLPAIMRRIECPEI